MIISQVTRGEKKAYKWIQFPQADKLSIDYGSSTVWRQNMKERYRSTSNYNCSNVSAIFFSNLKRAPRDCEGGLVLKILPLEVNCIFCCQVTCVVHWGDRLTGFLKVSDNCIVTCLGSLNPCSRDITGTIKINWYDLRREHKLTKVSTWVLRLHSSTLLMINQIYQVRTVLSLYCVTAP